VIPVFSRAESRAFDAVAIERQRVPGVVLMENAGRGVVDAIERHWPTRALAGAHVVVVCGVGNNGGDGFVVARHLLRCRATVRVFVVGGSAKVAGDARAHLDGLSGLGVAVAEIREATDALATELARATFVVDAVFGTGLSREIEGVYASTLEAIARAGRPVVAVDVPSGLDADTGASLGPAVTADLTVTFVAHKRGLLTPRGARLAGRVVVADIGVPPPKYPDTTSSARLLERQDVAELVRRRAIDLHKNGAGHVVVFAGSPGHVGAAVMCAHGAFRAGAGLVTVATWPEVAASLDARVVEVMTVPLDRSALDASVDAALARADVVVIGPGFGKDEDAERVLARVLRTWQGPSVVDADAIAMCAGEPELFAASLGAPILTPHPGELGVLLGTSARDVEADRFGALGRCLERARSVTLLKGAHTLIGAPDESPVVNGSGCAALATAGSGDVLAGAIAALACTLDPFEAAFVGVHVHGLAGEAWSRAHAGADRGLLAHEIADELPGVLGELSSS
jgi:NAD(P)H-hydrate epimerase